MRTKLQRLILFMAAGLFILPLILGAILPPQTAYAAQSNPLDQLNRWLYYRGMRACLYDTDFSPNTAGDDNGDRNSSDINEGHLLPNPAAGDHSKKGFGYLGPSLDDGEDNDGTVACGDGSIFVRGATIFGFSNPVQLVCAMNRALTDLGDGGRITPSDASDCEASTKFHFDGGGGDIFQRALTKALENEGSKDRPPFNINDNNGPDYSYKAVLYLIGKRSLEVFCGNNISLIDGAAKGGDIANEDVVSVDVVHPDGTIDSSQPYALTNPDRNQSSKVDDVYYNQGGDSNEAQDLKCDEMATLTRDNSKEYAEWARNHQVEAEANEGESQNSTETSTDGGTGDDTTSCAVDGIGWIVCPVLTFVASVTDAAYSAIDTMLTVQPLTTNGDGPYEGWSIMRNLANVAFVVAFLFIIYSQITGAGLTNYGIKKMLPKLIVAAILVNTSYWLCSIAVDVSNILGTSFKGLFDSMNTQLYQPGDQTGTGTWSKITDLVLVGGILLYLTLSVLGPMLVVAAFAIITVVLVLTLRQALIIILIVISPLAFVAYLLPNTEQWFKKWLGLLRQLLLMFPIIAVIFGGSAVAGTIITNSAANVSNEASKIILQIMGAGVTIIPLAITPIIMKTAGGVLNRFGGIVNNPNKGPFDRLRKGAEGYRDKRQNIAKTRRLGRSENVLEGNGRTLGKDGSRRRRVAAWIGGSGASAGVNAAARSANAEAALKKAQQDYVAGRAFNSESSDQTANLKYAQSIAGPTGNTGQIVAAAVAAQNKAFGEEVSHIKATMSKTAVNDLFKVLHDTAASQETRAAAAGMIMKNGGDQHVQEALDYVAKNQAQPNMKAVQQQMAEDIGNRKPEAYSGTQMSSLGRGELKESFNESLANRVKAGKIGSSELLHMSGDELTRLAHLAKTDPDIQAAMPQLQAAMTEINSNETLKGQLKPETTKLFTEIIALTGPSNPLQYLDFNR